MLTPFVSDTCEIATPPSCTSISPVAGVPGLPGPAETVTVNGTGVLVGVAGTETLVVLTKPVVIAPNNPSCPLLIPAEKKACPDRRIDRIGRPAREVRH